ncbi:MAG: hypothetical protein K6357_02840 [Elusimicrobiota bacterium]
MKKLKIYKPDIQTIVVESPLFCKRKIVCSFKETQTEENYFFEINERIKILYE